VRTPIHNLRGEAEVALSREREPGAYREALESCVEECGRLSRIVESLLFLARAERADATVSAEPVYVARELSRIRDFYEPMATEAGVDIAVEAPADVCASLDRTLLQRAVANLVENALAHTRRGGRVWIQAAPGDGELRLTVADDGCGIPEEHLPRVFDRLYRVDSSRTGETGGAGLGLSIVKTIAELHGGRASIESRPGEGTRVTIAVPT
jgi:two-component system heavy metal sensor histidine kinase CusS